MVFLFSLLAMASASQIRIEIPESLICSSALTHSTNQARQILEQTLPKLVAGSRVEAVLTSYPNLGAGLLAAGVTSDRRRKIMAIDQFTRAGAQNSLALGQLHQQLLNIKSKPGLLYICLLPEDCETSFGTAAHLKDTGSDEFGRSSPHLILLKNNLELDAESLVEALYDTLARFAQYELFGRWAEANRRRIARGQRPDDKYILYTKDEDSQGHGLDPSFMQIVTESRVGSARMAYRLQIEADTAEMRQHARIFYGHSTMQTIHRYGPRANVFVERLKLSEQNILEFGDKTVLEMLATIEVSPP